MSEEGLVEGVEQPAEAEKEVEAPIRRAVKRRVPKRRGKDGKARRPKRRRKKKPALREIEELPSLTYLIGGEQARWLIPAAFAAMLLLSAWGGIIDWRREYTGVPEGFDGTPKEYHNCIVVHNLYGDRNSTSHDPSHPDNIACSEKHGEDPNYSELEYQAWLDEFLASVAVDTGNHSGYVWTEGGIATMAYLGSTMGSNMSVYYDPAPGDEFNATHLAIWNSATTAFGGGNDSFADLLPGGASAMSMYIGAGGIVEDKPTGYMWTEVGIGTMTYLWALNGANMSMYGDPEPGDVFTEAHLGIWNGATVAFGGGNDSMEDLLPGGGTALALYVGATGIVDVAPTGFVWTEEGLQTMAYLWAMNGANMSMYGDPEPGDVFTEAHLGIWNGATVAFGGGSDAMQDLVPGGGTALAMYVGAGGIVQWSNLSAMPVATNVSVTPASPGVDDALACVYEYTDPQGDVDASSVRWYVNNVSIGEDVATVSLSTGDVVSCSVLPSDGINPGFRNHSDDVVIG